jgi:diguanylate cyclase (GGDEF)-like protein
MIVRDHDWTGFLEATLISVLQGAEDGAIILDADGRCQKMGRHMAKVFGVDAAKQLGKTRGELLRSLAEASDAEVGQERSIARFLARIHEYASLDALTGVPSIARFQKDLSREHGRSVRAWDNYAILRVDVDGMKALNETYGTPAGDGVLEGVAETLTAQKREYDVVARMDADEFIVLLPGTDAFAARIVGERMQTAVHNRAFDVIGAQRVTVSIGGCIWIPPSPDTSDDVVRRARAAMSIARSGTKAAQIHVLESGGG